jgi:hypothetical protein
VLKALFLALELLFPLTVLAVLEDVRAATTRAFIDNHFSDHASLYHQLAFNHYPDCCHTSRYNLIFYACVTSVLIARGQK